MVADNTLLDNLKKYTSKSEDELMSIIRKYPYYAMPKMALLIQRGTEDKSLLNHVALTSYDRVRLEEHIKNRDFFLKEK